MDAKDAGATDAPLEEEGPRPGTSNFIRDIVAEDLGTGRRDKVIVRFPPEPNGFPHIGHAKTICLNFALARDFDGQINLRFDDTNPETEDIEYVEAIKRDVRWLGFEWDEELYASDYFEQLYDWAVELIKKGKAYVDDLTLDEIRAYRGTVTEPGRLSPHRDRSVDENLALFEQMKNGAFEDGAKVLRAKIDMASPNMLLRDPVMYRIRKAEHYRRGWDWCLYPTYDWAHGQSDAVEGITHSICTLEFEVHRPLYDWYLDALGIDPRPQQYEFARGNIDYTVMSKRKLRRLVEEGIVSGWDDPRMPTISGLRRRGVRPEAIRAFWDRVGITRADSRLDLSMFEHAIRDDLNHEAPRVMAVLRPLKVVITNYPENQVEWIDAPYWPHDVPRDGTRKVPFARILYIEREDFMEDPPRKFHRLAPGREVRLRYGFIIQCDEVIKDAAGEVVELRCTYDPASKSGGVKGGRKVKGTIHWVSALHALPAEVRLYDRLFTIPDPDDTEEGETFLDHLNPASVEVLTEARIEPSVADDPPGMHYQFERQGFFWPDPEDATPERLVFNRIVTLRDTWAKLSEKGQARARAEKAAEAKPPAKPAAPAEARDPREGLTAPQLARFERYHTALGLAEEDAALLAGDDALAAFFEAVLVAHNDPQAAANWLIHVVLGELKDGRTLEALAFGPADLAALLGLMGEGSISGRIAKDVFAEMLETGDAPATIVERRGLRQIANPDALTPVIEGVLAAFPDKVVAYQEGKTGLLGFFVGRVMAETRGQAHPELAKQLLLERL